MCEKCGERCEGCDRIRRTRVLEKLRALPVREIKRILRLHEPIELAGLRDACVPEDDEMMSSLIQAELDAAVGREPLTLPLVLLSTPGAEEPATGTLARMVWKDRMAEVRHAIRRYLDDGQVIPGKLWDELCVLQVRRDKSTMEQPAETPPRVPLTQRGKAPSGLRPRWIAEEQRKVEVKRVVDRYVKWKWDIPEEWLEELRYLEDRLAAHNQKEPA